MTDHRTESAVSTQADEQGAKVLRQSHVWAREENEHYVEPEWVSERLFEEENFHPDDRVGSIWDPCCGFGRIPSAAGKAGYAQLATDLVDRGYPLLCKVSDFLTLEIRGHDIVCNPPFDIAPAFAAHAVDLCRQWAALVFPTARLNAAHWIKALPLRRVWLLSPRPSMPPGYVIASGEKPGGGKMDFCWLVFERGFEGTPELRWLYRDRAKH